MNLIDTQKALPATKRRQIPRILVTINSAQYSRNTHMGFTHKSTIIRMMHVSGHKPQNTFMDHIKLSSDEIADEIDAITAQKKKSSNKGKMPGS